MYEIIWAHIQKEIIIEKIVKCVRKRFLLAYIKNLIKIIIINQSAKKKDEHLHKTWNENIDQKEKYTSRKYCKK